MNKKIEKLPTEFLNKLKTLYPAEFVNICNTFLSERKTTFRVNYLKNDLRTLRKTLINEHIKVRELQDVPGAFLLDKTTLRELQKTKIYNEGHIYVQNISSMIPAFVLFEDVQEDIDWSKIKILDLCAAPGGKTTQMASLTNGKADIRAVEKNRPRFFKMQANIKGQGAEDCIKTFNTNGQAVFKNFENYFEFVLVDAPCSCESGFNANVPRSYSFWSSRKVNECRSKQKRLLFSGLKSLKSGGTLVYSTCTMSPEENEAVVSWALKRFEGEVKVDKIKFNIKNSRDGVLEWKDKTFDKSVKLTKRILPTDIMESFYIAKFKKI